MTFDFVHPFAVCTSRNAESSVLPAENLFCVCKVRLRDLQAFVDVGQLCGVNCRLARESVYSIEYKLVLQPVRPRTAGFAEIVPNRS